MPAPSLLDTLLARRVLFVSGKGGVGKSAVAAAVALGASRRGRRVLLVEIDAPLESASDLNDLGSGGPGGGSPPLQERRTNSLRAPRMAAARYLGAPGRVGAVPTEVQPGLWVQNLDPRGVMDEFVRRTVKVDFVARRILQSPIYERFFAAAPGLKELMTLGKVMVLEGERARGGAPEWDLIVVDAPATGHGLSFLKVPVAAAAAVPVGPVGHNARRILDLLRDPARTGLLIVAIPEEMAVVEAAQFQRQAEDEVGIETLALVLSACHERRLTPAQEAEVLARLGAGEGDSDLGPALRAARRHIRRRRLTQFHRTRLRRAAPLPLLSLPYVFDEDLGLPALTGFAEILAQAPA